MDTSRPSALDPEALRVLAIRIKERVYSMSTAELDDWYQQHVGYKPTEDDPRLIGQPLVHCALVASVMFFYEAPGGLAQMAAEQGEFLLDNAVLHNDDELLSREIWAQHVRIPTTH